MLTWRAAGQRDSAVIGVLHAAGWQETYAELLPGTSWAGLAAERVAMWHAVLGDPAAYHCIAVLVIEDDDRMIGFGCCGRQRDSALADAGYGGEIYALYVLRSHHRRGAGRTLMAALAQALEEAGHAAASLWVVRDNVSARLFYEAQGGSMLGERETRHEGVMLREAAYGWHDLSRLTD